MLKNNVVNGMLSKSKLLEFRKDLQNGLSIAEACSKHDVSFGEVVLGLNPLQKRKNRAKKARKVTWGTPAKYIFQRNDTFTIRKTVKSRCMVFGTYSSLDDAIRVRDELIRIGWKRRSVDRICEQFGITRRERSGHHVRYS